MLNSTGKPKRGITSYQIDGVVWYYYITTPNGNYLLSQSKDYSNLQEFNADRLNLTRKKRSEINKVSDKQEKINRAYAVISSQFKKDHPICQVCIKCKGAPTTDCHHPIGRIGNAMLDSTQYIATCRACHNYLEAHPTHAKELGFSKSRLQTTQS